MSVFTFIAQNEQDTERLAQQLAKLTVPGTVMTLDGDLGAGKTRFSQGFARAIGVQGVVNSPTFTIIKEYMGSKLPFYHMDVYRISIEEADELGLDEYFYGDGVTLVEWSSLIEDILPPQRLEMKIERIGESDRKFTIIPHGKPYTQWCSDAQENGWLTHNGQ
ncbi:tRNA (adenosine(37)-N6)-threonylcarbamoyltransferase complex ATPase subunit type 1 TsaE [Paenibacillus sp. N1-5-1-14]|uniref:tRNA (adenosine(37)-N6)-threonylcarbamoyltransferase complex ATPase subunit type 1 TsaE n=1 Tax=Paenibacillus radicibacter TaxID=2972488 RepID=UPI0021592E27|nr:tRNA (adenosine(37)-N6)-threonylcarbamoyltransferase complex ATPase subunit type 1 TsaE [Paenibacillus radicibacter]MCR8643581.1 tRNA (adenosine(37)-N6)-threonylcarbamoyltransferase complex ATPase subunit type 1 TsaE [Paenibacillus radicibacter]